MIPAAMADAGSGSDPAVQSPVPSMIFAGIALLLISIVVLLILRFYLPLRTTPAYLLVPVFFALWLPASMVLLVPIDLASSAKTDDVLARGIWLEQRVLLVGWRITYWLTFSLTWFILPILAEYSDSGYREPKDKVIDSLRSNAQYYGMMFGAGVLGFVYVLIYYGHFSESLKSTVMALAYCWGLVLAIYLMGHGLVAIPRRLFRNASISGRLRTIQCRAPRVHEQMEDAEQDLDEVEMEVFELSKRTTGSAVTFRDWVEELVDMTNLPEEHPRAMLADDLDDRARNLPTVITEKYMANLTRRLVRARHARSRYVNEWNSLLRDAVRTQAILDSGPSKKLDFGTANPEAGFWDRITVFNPYTRYLFYFHAVPYIRLIIGGLLAIASACIIWSEVVKGLLPNFSVIRYSVVHYWNGGKGQVGFAGQAIAVFWMLYMCASALISITEVKVWRGRALVRRNTAHESAFWYASQVARLSIPLSYNFMTFLGGGVYGDTVFYDFLGQLINLTPLGKWFDFLFPAFILVPVCATLFGLYSRVRDLFGFGDVIGDDGNDGADDAVGNTYSYGTWREGRDLIERELNGPSAAIRRRRTEAAGRSSPAGGASANKNNTRTPILTVPGSRTRHGRAGPSTPLGTSPNVRPQANTSARRAGPPARRGAAEEEDDDGFFGAFGHRIKNTIDTLDTPKWLQDIGQGIKKPKWMGGGGDEDGGEGSGAGGNNRPQGPGRGNSDVRRWFGGGEGRIRL